ncbi:Fe-S protein assembly co-chaperone HscB [Pedobacter sp. SYSU D00535]|uniref:Fe-S protein assembly co-chaperone HscB n=1 Tax=Pedobacter sp. SYSU D00535 TaxID=2810308 RepID=UPI001A95E153|nr:Fe-S protein assembly co-chaperone HscB [Pedobacter sp. SYSU D00535]
MNYFEFYGVPEAFHLDEAVIKRKFYALSKEFHPDFYINEREEKQQEILELSTLNNKAFQVLSKPARRLEYILQSHGLVTEGEKYQLPQSFLIEVMDVNETLMELEFDPDPAALAKCEQQIAAIEEELSTTLKGYTEGYDIAGNNEEKEVLLLKIKDLYYRQKYLLRIRERLNTFAHR